MQSINQTFQSLATYGKGFFESGLRVAYNEEEEQLGKKNPSARPNHPGPPLSISQSDLVMPILSTPFLQVIPHRGKIHWRHLTQFPRSIIALRYRRFLVKERVLSLRD